MSEALKKIQEELEAKRESERRERLGIGRFSGSNTRQPSGDGRLAHRVFTLPTAESAERFEKMRQPASSSHPFTPVREVMKSTATAQLHHNRYADTHGPADFFRLLEEKYGAIKGYIPSYEAAMDKYHSDTERIEKENAIRIETERHRSERSASIAQRSQQQQDDFLLSQQEDAARFQHNFRMGHQAKPEEPEEPRGWSSRFQDMFGRAKAYARFARSHPYSQQHSEKPHARGGPAQGGPGQRRKMPRAKALVIMGFAANSDPSYDALKKAFNKQALLLHPDKNLANPEEAAIKFKKMRRAFNSLTDKGTSDSDSEGGGIIKRRHKRYKTSKKARRNTRRKTRGKTHRKTHRKSHRKSNKRR